MQTGNGKIANLPAEIRDELNYRLNDGEPGNELVEWLNSKPEVVEVITKLFDGRPISEQNLSQWRTHGYRAWHAHRGIVDGTLALSDNTGEIAETGIDCDKLLLTLTAAYAEAIQSWIITPGEQLLYKLAVYKNLTNGVIALRRAELLKVRLEIERERLELLREKRGNRSSSSSSSPESSSTESAPPPGPSRPKAPEPSDPRRTSSFNSSEPPAEPPLGNTPAGPLASPADPPRSEPSPVAPSRPFSRPGGPPSTRSPRNPLGLL